MPRLHDLAEWLDARTGWRRGRAHLLDEPIAPGVGWWFVTGSVVLMLLAVQFVTGVVLAMYYVPSPDHAYDSIRFVTERVVFGSLLRDLHFFGASFIVVAAVIHMLRVVALGSYKKPRELTWVTGVVLLLVILAFALSGYLLPWDQKAYWATTVTINIARSGPMGELVAGVLKGGESLGALTLVRWYAAHVFLLPAALIGLVLAHVYLMRRHGISGPVTPVPGEPKPFYPYHALKDTLAGAVVFALLLTCAAAFAAPLDPIADPTDATFVPRPEWYFLSLFELLKYFPGPLEPLATMVLPALVVGGLLLLPFLDRGSERRLVRRPIVAGAFAIVGAGIIWLTVLGYRDSPVRADPSVWGPLPVAGEQFVRDDQHY
jgi:ubiquinol-cytochrome c reductase cytochrome b subunit